MKKLLLLTLFSFALLFSSLTVAQVLPTSANPIVVNSATGTGAPSTFYATLAAAVTAINAGTAHTGTISCLILAGYTETAPTGGYSITATGTVAAPITFAKSGAGANPTFTAPAQTGGLLNDAIFKIIGGDYITIDGFTMLERTLTPVLADTTQATNTMTEFGIVLFYATAINNCQNITLRNNTIDLDRRYQNTFGIYANATTTASAPAVLATATGTAGGNNNLTITTNNITDINMGIVVVGPTAIADYNDNVIIGGTGNGNVITNYGTTGTFSGYISVSGTVNGILVRNTKNTTISNNTIASSVGGVISGTLNGIQIPAASNTPTGLTFTVNINSNNISLKSGLITGAMNGILVPSGSASTTSILNVNNNDFNNFGHTVAGTVAITFISNASTHFTTSISNNTFTNMSVNTTGSVTFISNSWTLPAGGTKNVNSNSIVTAFNKTGAGGTISLYINNGSSPTGTFENNNGNNFSNITVTGATIIAGWSNTDGLAASIATKNINNNTFSNWTGGSSSISGLVVNYFGGVSSISNNTVSNFTGSGAMTGISIGSSGTATTLAIDNNTVSNLVSSGTGGTVLGMLCSNPSTVVTISNNKINTLSSTGVAVAVSALTISGGSPNITKNKIYNISVADAGSSVNGVNITAATTVTMDNNYIGDLRAAAATGLNAVVGVNANATATYNLYFNTVYLNATSTSATTFGSSAVLFSSTATALNLRNNILVNASTPGLNSSNLASNGVSAVLRRSTGTAATVPTNYATTSNNNLFWSNPSSGTNNHATYIEGTSTITNAKNTVADVKTFMVNRDQNSVQENAPFISTTGTDATFLHIDPTVATGIEKGAVAIATYTTDYDGDTRGSVPDIGADEGTFTPLATPVISSLATTSGCQGASLVVNGTNMLGVATATIGGTAATVTATTATTATLTIGSGTTGIVTLTSPSGTATGTDTFTVNPAPTTTWAASTTAVCPSASAQTTTLAYTATTGTPTSYSITWSATPTNSFVAVSNQTFSGTPGGGTITINVPAGAISGTYTGTIKVTNAGGCISVGTQTFTVVVGTVPVTPTTTSLSICTGATIASGTGLASTSVGAATLTGSQTLSFNVTAQPTETQTSPGSIVATASLTALPAGAVVTSVVYAYNGIEALSPTASPTLDSWISDVRLGLSGVLINAEAGDSGTAVNLPGVFNYDRIATSGITGTPLVGGNVNLLYVDAGDDNTGAEALFPTGSGVATVVVNYSYPNPTAISWFTAPSGGTSIGSGSPFNPVGVAGSGLANTNTAGTTPFYVEVSNGTCPSTRVVANLVIGAPLSSTATTTATPVCEGIAVTINNTPVGGSLPYTYSWSNGTTVVGSSKSLSVTPTTTTTYTVTVTDGCLSTTNANIVVTVNPTPLLTIVNPAAICSPATVDITTAGVQTVNNGTTTKYYTTNALALAGASGDVTTPTALGSGTYYIRSESTAGCFKILPVTVTVNTSPSTISVLPTTANVCDDTITPLVASGGSVSGTGTIGTGTVVNSTTSFPNPFSGFYGGAKNQMIYLASELSGQGLSAGSSINTVGLNISAFTANACTNLTIRMKNSNLTVLTGIEAGTTTVYGPLTYTPSAIGWNSFTLTTPFIWDGTSNIIVEFVHNAGNSGNGSGTTVNCSTTTGNKTFYVAKDNVAGSISGFDAATFTTTGGSTSRPNVRFNYSLIAPITWAPTTGLYTNALATAPYTGGAATTVYHKGVANTYTATATLGTCTKTATSVLTLNPKPTLASVTATSACENTPSTVTMTGLLPNTAGSFTYTNSYIPGPVFPLSGTSDASGNFSFVTPNLPIAANGALITITSSTVTATGCTTAFTGKNVTVVVTPNTSITTQPVSQAICVGSPVTFSVVAANSATGYLYEWRKNNVIIPLAGNATYTIAAVAAADAASYTVVVVGECGAAVTSSTAVLTVNPLITPTFAIISSVCSGSFYALPNTSIDGIGGTWAPAFDNLNSGSYTFTPTTGQCATVAVVAITITPQTVPTFASIPVQCSGTSLVLPTTSSNNITGSWAPAFDTLNSGTYTFTPTTGQCATTATLEVTITPSTTVITAVTACDTYTWANTGLTYITSGTYAGTTTNCVTQELVLTITPSSTVSTPVTACDTYTWANTGLTYITSGTYAGTTTNCVTQELVLTITPSSTNNTNVTVCQSYTWANNSVTYTNSGVYFGSTSNCVSEQLTLTINPLTVPTFDAVATLCAGDTYVLPTTSTNNITGTWSPAFDNLNSDIYTFTPTAGQCAATATLPIIIGGTTTWSGTLWTNGTPTSTSTAIISANYSEPANLEACTLTVSGNAVVTIPSGTNVTLQGAITVTSGSFTLSNNANLIQSRNVVNSGNIIVKRETSLVKRLDYVLWSSPVASQNLLAFSPLTTVTPTPRFYTYNSSTNSYNSIAPSSNSFAKGAGYLIRIRNNQSASVASAWTGTFTGVPNNGPVSLSVVNNTFNALGNPYPSTISADNFITANGLTGALYFWKKDNNLFQVATPTSSYATYTLAGGVGTTANTLGGSNLIPNGVIEVGQGFIAKATSTSLIFTNAMRIANNGNQFFRTTEDRSRIWMNLTNTDGLFSQALVAYMPNASSGIDAAIDGRLLNDTDGGSSLSSLIENQEFAVQGRALPFETTDVVPMAFKAATTGNYTIAIDHTDGLFIATGQAVYLKDNLLATTTDLATPYTFASNAGVFNNRFEIVYQPAGTLATATPTLNDRSVIVYKQNENIVINTGKIAMTNVKIFDIRGRLLIEKSNINATDIKINTPAANQVLIVKITSNNNEVVTKKVIN